LSPSKAASSGTSIILPSGFDDFIGNRRAVDALRRALAQNRLPHALIFAGPSGIGKCTLALVLAKHLNCMAPVGGACCNACASCRKIEQSLHPDVRIVAPDGAFIKIDQIRALIDEIAYQPFEGRFRIAIIDGADLMRTEAANCLLKTLEEPPSRSILILITPKPYSLLITIRSRSRLIHFGSLPEAAIAEYLVRQGRIGADAELAAALSNGSLGQALSFDAAQGREVRQQALRFVSMLLRKEGFAQASPFAAATAKDKDSFPGWVEMTGTLLQDIYYAQVAPSRMSQRDIAAELKELAGLARREKVVSAIEAIKNLRSALQRNVNRQLALESLFLSETGN
jgi:DNA polymerase-3 subunit delta'